MMSSAHRSPTRSTARATPLYWPRPRAPRVAMRRSGRRRGRRARALLCHVGLGAHLGRGGLHEQEREVVAVGVVEVARVHEPVVLRLARLGAARRETLLEDLVDGLARLAGE